MEPSLKAELRSSSGRSSKLPKDRESIETVVEVVGVGTTLVLAVDGAGGYSLRAYPEGGDAGRDLLAVGGGARQTRSWPSAPKRRSLANS